MYVYIQNIYVCMCAYVYIRLGKFKWNMKGFLKEHKEQLKANHDDILYVLRVSDGDISMARMEEEY